MHHITAMILTLAVILAAWIFVKVNQSVEVTMNSFIKLIAYGGAGIAIALIWVLEWML